MNKLVLEKLLKFLGKKDLLKCRLVSRLWNKIIVNSLTQTPENFRWYKNLNCNLNVLANRPNWQRTLKTFHRLLERSKYPELLLHNVYISHRTMHTPQCKKILRHFGQFIKSLVIKDDQDLTILSRCLGHYGLCPNLEHLDVTVFDENIEEDLPHFVEKIGLLKLKTLEFYFHYYRPESPPYPRPIFRFLMLFEGILSNSPDTEVLKLSIKTVTSSSDLDTHRFIQVIQSKPEITRELKDFELNGNVVYNFQTLSLIEFGPRLKKICLDDLNNARPKGWTQEDRQQTEVVDFEKFLESVSPTLEYLNLRLWRVNSVNLMGKLLKKFYSLKILELNTDESYDELLESCFGRDFDSLEWSPPVINEQLEYLHLKATDIRSPVTIRNLNAAFPNLLRLKVIPPSQGGCSSEETKSWFEQFFLFISQMNNLKELSIDCDWRRERVVVDFQEAFSNLKNTPNLVELTLTGLRFDRFKATLIANALPALLGAPKLRRVNADLILKLKRQMLKTTFEESNIKVYFE